MGNKYRKNLESQKLRISASQHLNTSTYNVFETKPSAILFLKSKRKPVRLRSPNQNRRVF